MTTALVLKILDLAFLSLSAWDRYQTNQKAGDSTAARINEIRNAVLVGDMTADAAANEIDALIESIRQRRKRAIDALPKPPLFEPLDSD